MVDTTTFETTDTTDTTDTTEAKDTTDTTETTQTIAEHQPTLDELIARAQEAQEAQEAHRKVQEAAEAAAQQEAARRLRDHLNDTLSAQTQAALGVSISPDGNRVTFVVDDHLWCLRPRDDGQWWYIYPPDFGGDSLTTFLPNVERDVLLAIADWRWRVAQRSVRVSDSVTSSPVVTKTVTAPRLIQEQAVREDADRWDSYGACRIYELSASSGCGSLDQYEQVVARIGADGGLDLAYLSGRDDDETGGTVRHTIPPETMATLLPLYTAYMAEIAAAKAAKAAKAATDLQQAATSETSQQEDEPPF